MECASPRTKEAMGKQMALLHMKQMQEQIARMDTGRPTVDVDVNAAAEVTSNLTDKAGSGSN